MARCKFNRPYACIKVFEGTATEVLPTLSWKKRTIVWLDYTEKLSKKILDDVELLISQARSGSAVVWSVNADPWGSKDEDGSETRPADLPAARKRKLQELFNPAPVPAELLDRQLSKWGLSEVFYALLIQKIRRALGDRNASSPPDDVLHFLQCFHFRYADGVKMLTVGGLLLNGADKTKLGPDPFAGLHFVRAGESAFEILAPMLTGREVRFLNSLLPDQGGSPVSPDWLQKSDFDHFCEVYRYYPIFAESEL